MVHLAGLIFLLLSLVGCGKQEGFLSRANSLAVASQHEFVVPRISDSGVDVSVLKTEDLANVYMQERPSVPCGAVGTLTERIGDCSKKNVQLLAFEDFQAPQRYSWSLISLTADGAEIWLDNLTSLIWSDRVGGKDAAKKVNWCKASGSNNALGSPFAEDDPQDYCDNERFQNQNEPVSLCGEDAMYLNGIEGKDSLWAKGSLSAWAHSSDQSLLTWRLPTIEEFRMAFRHSSRAILPRGDHRFWSASVPGNDNRGMAWIFYGQTGTTVNFYRGGYLYAVRCVAKLPNKGLK